MKITLNFIPEALVDAMGWTLLHSIWQGLLVLVITFGIISFFRSLSASKRYTILTTSLFAFVLIVFATFILHLYDSSFGQPEMEITAATSQLTLNQLNYDIQAETSIGAMIENHTFWIVGGWLFGVLFFTLRLTGGLLYLRRIKKSAYSDIPDLWNKAFEKVAQRLDITQKVVIRISDLIDVPMVIGVVKPMVLIPASLLTGLNEEQIRAILYHELAHIKRWDYLFNIIQSIVEVVFFFNPFVWIMSKYIRKEREHCCDDVACNLSEDSFVYIDALARLAEIKYSSSNLSLTLAKSNNELLDRIKRMTGHDRLKTFDIRGFLALITITALFAFSFHAYSNRNNDQSENFNLFEAGVTLDLERENDNTSNIYATDLVDQLANVYQQSENGNTTLNDTTKDERWKLEVQQMFQQRFKDFYAENKEEVDRIIEEINVTMIKQNSQIEELSRMLELQSEKNAYTTRLQKTIMEEKQRELQKTEQELELKARQMQLENQIKQLRTTVKQNEAIREQEQTMSEQEREVHQKQLELKRKMQVERQLVMEMELERLRKLEQSKESPNETDHGDLKKFYEELDTENKVYRERETVVALEKLMEKYKQLELQKRELDMKHRELELQQFAEIMRNLKDGTYFQDQLVKNLIEDGYIEKEGDLKTVDVAKDGLIKINGEPIKKKHKKKYKKLFKLQKPDKFK